MITSVRFPVGVVAVRGLERRLFRRVPAVGDVQPPTVGIALQRLLVLAIAEAGLVAPVVGVERPQVGGELRTLSLAVGLALEPRPEPGGADRL